MNIPVSRSTLVLGHRVGSAKSPRVYILPEQRRRNLVANTAKVQYVIWGHDGRGGVRPRKFVFPDEIEDTEKVVAELRRLWMVKDVYKIGRHTSIVVRVRFSAYNLILPGMAKAIARAFGLDHLVVESTEYWPAQRRCNVVIEKNRWGSYSQRKLNRGMIVDI